MTVDQLGIEHQTVFGLPPVAFVNLAADLGSARDSPCVPVVTSAAAPLTWTRWLSSA